MATCLLELESVTRAYPEFTLAAGFGVYAGEFFAILGPSGSGKTTLLRLIAGFDRPDGGRIILDGRDITRLPPDKRCIGMVFQEYTLFPHLDVAGNIGYGLKLKGVPAKARLAKVEELLALTGLAGYAHRDPSSLSGGEKQRVAVARALAAEPRVLLFDEPFSALDQSLRRHLRREIQDLQRRSGFTALFVTHSQEEALSLADRMLVMSRGRVEQVGAPAEIYLRPDLKHVAGFLGEMNRLPAMVDRAAAALRIGAAALPLPSGESWPEGPGLLYFRPEACRLAREMSEDGLCVKLLAREFTGSTTSYTVAGDGYTAEVLCLSNEAPLFAPGESLRLVIALAQARFVPAGAA